MSAERSYVIPVWNGVLAHRRHIGAAIWVFMWCIDRTTREENGVGFVLGGTVIKVERIAEELDESERHVRRDLKHLAASGYIGIERHQYGLVITVHKSKKFGASRPDRNVRSDSRSDRTRMSDLEPKMSDVIRKTEQMTEQLTEQIFILRMKLRINYEIQKHTPPRRNLLNV